MAMQSCWFFPNTLTASSWGKTARKRPRINTVFRLVSLPIFTYFQPQTGWNIPAHVNLFFFVSKQSLRPRNGNQNKEEHLSVPNCQLFLFWALFDFIVVLLGRAVAVLDLWPKQHIPVECVNWAKRLIALGVALLVVFEIWKKEEFYLDQFLIESELWNTQQSMAYVLSACLTHFFGSVIWRIKFHKWCMNQLWNGKFWDE